MSVTCCQVEMFRHSKESKMTWVPYDAKKCDRNFLRLVRPLLLITCMAGIMPVGVYQTADGKFSVKLLHFAWYLYSLLFRCVTFVATVISTILTYRWFEDQTYTVYLATRLGLITLAQFSFIGHRKDLVETLKNYHAVGVSPPIFEYFITCSVILYIVIVIVSIILYSIIDTGVNVFMAVYVFIHPPVVYIFPSAIYSIKMAITAAAIEDLNKELLNIVHMKSTSSDISSELRRIMKQHVLLRKICFEANVAFGITIMLTNAAVFVEVIYYLFIACVASSFTIIFLSIGWAFVNVSPTLFVMFVGQCVENSGKILYMQLREWRIQMKQLPLRFTAYNFFDLNSEQMKNILATMGMYTIILIQNTARPLALQYVQDNL